MGPLCTLVFGTGDMVFDIGDLVLDTVCCCSLCSQEMDIAFALLMQIVGALPHTPLLTKPIDVCLLVGG